MELILLVSLYSYRNDVILEVFNNFYYEKDVIMVLFSLFKEKLFLE